MIVSIYDQPLAFIDLTEDDDMDTQAEPQEDEDQILQEWLVIDEHQEDDLPEPEEEPDNEGDEMLFAFDHLLGNQDTESDYSDESESDYEDSDILMSESEDSGVEVYIILLMLLLFSYIFFTASYRLLSVYLVFSLYCCCFYFSY